GCAVQLAMLSMRERLPASFTTRPMVQAGLLMSYGVDIIDTFRQVGVYTATILKGTRPADLPVQQSTKLQLVFNLQTAKALGLEPKLEKVPGNALRGSEVTGAVTGMNAVIQVLGVGLGDLFLPVHLFSDATRILLVAMQAQGVKRLICVTGF